MNVSADSSNSDMTSDRVTQVRRERSPDESVHGEGSSLVNVVRFALPKDARDLIIAVVLAAAILTIWALWSKLHDAEKDIQTQIWLRDDALTKFEQGPFADLKAHVLALEMTCRK